MKFIGLLTKRFLLQSLVPVFVVFLSVFVLLAIVKYRSGEELSSTVVIRIPASEQALAGEGDEDEGDTYEQLDVALDGLTQEQRDDLTRARVHAQAREWLQAKRIYSNMRQQQDSPVVQTELALLYYKMGDPEKSLRSLDETISEYAELTDAWFSRGVVLSALAKYPEAVRDYREVIRRQPYHIEAHINLGLALIKSGDARGAMDILEKAADMSGGDKKAKVLVAFGDACRKSGQAWVKKARKAYKDAIRIRPEYALPRMRLAAMEPNTRAGRKRAMDYYQQVMRLDLSHARARFFAGRLSRDGGDAVLAEKYYREAIRIRPGYIKARYNLALLLLGANNLAGAERQFQEILARNDRHSRSLLQLGRIAYREKRYEDAHAWYDRAQQIADGNYAEAWLNKGLVSSRQKDYAAALRHYQRAARIEADYEQAYNNMGLVYAKMDDYASAEKNYRKAVSIREKYPAAWYNLALLYSKTGKTSQAIEAYEKAISFRPDYHKAMLNLGVLYAREQRYSMAIKIYRDVLAQDDTYAKAWYNLGRARVAQKEYAQAIEALQKGVGLEPDSLPMRTSLAEAYMGAGDHDRSIEQYRKAISLDESDINVRIATARAMAVANRKAEALVMLNQGLALDPGNETIVRQIRELGK